MVRQINIDQALALAKGYGLEVPFWTGMSVQNGAHQLMVCDYRHLGGYTVAFACEIWDIKAQRQVERFNIMRGSHVRSFPRG